MPDSNIKYLHLKSSFPYVKLSSESIYVLETRDNETLLFDGKEKTLIMPAPLAKGTLASCLQAATVAPCWLQALHLPTISRFAIILIR